MSDNRPDPYASMGGDPAATNPVANSGYPVIPEGPATPVGQPNPANPFGAPNQTPFSQGYTSPYIAAPGSGMPVRSAPKWPWFVGGGVVLLVIAMVATAASLLGGGAGGSNPPVPYGTGSGTPASLSLSQEWTFDPSTLGTDDLSLSIDNITGTYDRPTLLTTSGIVAAAAPATAVALVFSVDITDGSLQWKKPLPDAVCNLFDGDTLTCLTRAEPADPFDLVTLDAETGDITDTVRTELIQAPATLLQVNDGFGVITRDGMAVVIAADGAVTDIERTGSIDRYGSYERPRVAAVGTSQLLWSSYGTATMLFTETGITSVACDGVATGPSGWVCDTFEAIQGYDPAGNLLWSIDAYPTQLITGYSEISPIAMVEISDDEIAPLDLATGDIGASVQLSQPRDYGEIVGTAEHPLVQTAGGLDILAPAGDQVLAQISDPDGELSYARFVTYGDSILSIYSETKLIDAANGGVIWTANFDGSVDVVLDGDRVIAVGTYELTGYIQK